MILLVSSSNINTSSYAIVDNGQIKDFLEPNTEISKINTTQEQNKHKKITKAKTDNQHNLQPTYVSIQQLLQRNNIELSQIKEIVLDIGPGSFTGIRSAVSYIGGLFAFNDIINKTKDGNTVKITKVTGFDIMNLNFINEAHNIILNNELLFKLDKNNTNNILSKLETEIINHQEYISESVLKNISNQVNINHNIQNKNIINVLRELLKNTIFVIPRSNRSVYIKKHYTEKDGIINHIHSSVDELSQIKHKNNLDHITKIAVYSHKKILNMDFMQEAEKENFFEAKIQIPINVFTMFKALKFYKDLQSNNITTINRSILFDRGFVDNKTKEPIIPFYLGEPNGTQEAFKKDVLR